MCWSNCINFIDILEHAENIKIDCAVFILLNSSPSKKVFEKITFNSVFFDVNNNDLLNSTQSRFMGTTCVHQLILISHGIHKAFDANPSLEVREVFLDSSKTSDKVWHDDLLH